MPKVCQIAGMRLVKEMSVAAPDGYKPRAFLGSPKSVYEFMKPYADVEPAETFWVICLDMQHKAINGSPRVITRGILNSSLVHPREVFRVAIADGAAAIVLVHNHPSGNPTPSADDRLITEQLVASGNLLDIPVHDHIICGENVYTSFAEAGML